MDFEDSSVDELCFLVGRTTLVLPLSGKSIFMLSSLPYLCSSPFASLSLSEAKLISIFETLTTAATFQIKNNLNVLKLQLTQKLFSPLSRQTE